MTDDGNHGGSTELETNTIVFAYYKNGFLYNNQIESNQSKQLKNKKL